MKVDAYEAVIENGQVKFVENVRLPDKTRVFVVVPETEGTRKVHIYSPRLANPSESSRFVKEVIEVR